MSVLVLVIVHVFFFFFFLVLATENTNLPLHFLQRFRVLLATHYPTLWRGWAPVKPVKPPSIFILTVPRRYFCCGSFLLLVLAVRIYTLVQLLC